MQGISSNRSQHSQQRKHLHNRTAKEISVCANCCSSFISSTTSKTEENHPRSNSRPSTSSFLANEAAKKWATNDLYFADVNTMLLDIYNLEFIPRLKQKGYSTSGEASVETQAQDFPLCQSCTILLKSIYSLYSRFNQIRKIESLLSQQINTLNSLINDDRQNQNKESSHNNLADGDSKATIISTRKDIFDSQDITTTKTATSNRNSSNFEFPSMDRGPWVKVGPRLEDLTPEQIGYVPPSLRHLYQNAKQNLIYSDNFSTQYLSFSAQNDDDCDNINYEASPMSDSLAYEEEDVKPVVDDPTDIIELGSSKILTTTTSKSPPINTTEERKKLMVQEKKSSMEGNKPEQKQQSEPKNQTVDAGQKRRGRKKAVSYLDAIDVLANLPKYVRKPTVFQTKLKPKIRRIRRFKCTVVIDKEGKVCPYRTHNYRSLQKHVRYTHSDEKERVKCTTCNKMFKTALYLRIHWKRVHKEKLPNPAQLIPKETKCSVVINENGDVCPYQAKFACGLKRHMQFVHPDANEKVKCDECGKECKSSIYLQGHIERVHTVKPPSVIKARMEKKYACTVVINEGEVCPFRTNKTSNLKIHILRVHSKEEAVCHECGKVLKNELSLKSHFKHVHTEEGRDQRKKFQEKHVERLKARPKEPKAKVFSCKHCGVDFTTKLRLTIHLKAAHNEYTVKAPPTKHILMCELCGKTFRTNSGLKSHMETAHTGADERPFVCEECGLTFKSQLNLRRHRYRTHTEEGKQKYKSYIREFSLKRKLLKEQTAEKAPKRSKRN